MGSQGLFISVRGCEWTNVYNLRFPGQYYQAETGLNYNYFRDYDPQTPRFLESDPIALSGGINTYAWVCTSARTRSVRTA